ncbi:MAG: CRISPR-associated endonuclease Cas2 [Candidatus Staskawiczbacteria bacterium RIFCSPLOWO2_12_FULL_37_15]|uniref:CRISPR-associated endonuclease Cas2 n=1 Tax=Candidatus Staskawiczbacteria bacterium RIFCSPLOWO2_12_FULL_37_15 TaxID=1802218 RepID=A0A1G2ILJ5_9BACT|nr:MAG: CRISPR-associated endonuclease Cas2 [Candidatus Staskawiczbacteria bacterium RIFCSPLOWO2_12_FULL_37_15]
MKITVTDKFLWDIYGIVEGLDNNFSFLFSYPITMKNCLPGDSIVKIYRNTRNKNNFSKLIYYLKRKGYIKVKNLENKKAIILTKEGIDRAMKASFKIEKMAKRKDGKWIMIIFDIPQNHKKDRELLRSILINSGFKMFQQSVWITPYDVSEKIEKLLQMHSLDRYVKIFIIEEI